jgi:HSP20 family molecular chaperone IbpA
VTRAAVFNSPFLLGFDHLERLLERSAKSAGDGYPPYNIEQIDPERLRITLAVAGFSSEELSVTVEDKQLVIRGKQADVPGRQFLYRGIAARQFQRTYVLADGIEVASADLENGLLAITLTRPKAPSVLKKIAIRAKAAECDAASEGLEQRRSS